MKNQNNDTYKLVHIRIENKFGKMNLDKKKKMCYIEAK